MFPSPARSPVFSHMSATLNGISTIRSAGAQQRLVKEFDRFQVREPILFYYLHRDTMTHT